MPVVDAYIHTTDSCPNARDDEIWREFHLCLFLLFREQKTVQNRFVSNLF